METEEQITANKNFSKTPEFAQKTYLFLIRQIVFFVNKTNKGKGDDKMNTPKFYVFGSFFLHSFWDD
uniref:Uncharacterized protein n=1 Tax=uncultured bacterium contig00004 TaxID=1181496 RepID=A0A806KEW1_9BACT|nr:hypothetical protein [uncultured bacterium contig00004]